MAGSEERIVPGTSVREGQPTGPSEPERAPADTTESGGVRVKEGRLPVSELAADRPGGPSPFGDDLTFPLPVDELRYTHSTTPR
jgi:hypothetical protein